MGSGSSYSHKEIGATRGASANHTFELILDRIESSGGEITSDEETPFYEEIGIQNIEIGSTREVLFTLNKFDFKIIREVEEMRLTGTGKNKSVEKRDIPKVNVKLFKKPDIGENWLSIDLEALGDL